MLARFDAERQALALMDHPNIARIYGGVTPAGQPFFIMELVNGVPLTEYCDTHRLTVDARLQLFVQVCQAVQHAHQKGIIHRDLKPGNVLVTEVDGRPTPKVIDFGVAKATEQKLTDQSYSDTGAIVGTPAYMSPEQADPTSMDIDTRTDVYALGVMLYELLTGPPPIDSKQFKRGAILEMLRMVREVEPPRPSTKLSTSDALPNIAAARSIDPAKLAKLLRGELDWVVMKALEKDRTRRYDTANGLARDIQRYLADEVVEARPPSRGYRLRKFVKRNKGQVIAGGSVFFALLAGVVGTTWGLIEAQRQKRTAIAERETAENARAEEAKQRKIAESKEAEANAIIQFFERKVFAAARPEGVGGGLGKDVTLRAAIIASLKSLASGFGAQPIVEARLRRTLGTTFSHLGDDKTSLEQFERARSLFTERLGPDHGETVQTLAGLAGVYGALDRNEDALALRERVLEIRRRTLPPDDTDTLDAVHDLANTYYQLGRHEEAFRLRKETHAAYKRILGPDDASTLDAAHNLAISLSAVGRDEDQLALFEEVLAIRRRAYPKDDLGTIMTMGVMANVYAARDRDKEALKLREEVLAAYRRVFPPEHPNVLDAAHNLSNSYLRADKDAEAIQLREEVLAIRRKVLPADHTRLRWSLNSLALSYAAVNRHAEAVPLFEEVLAADLRTVGPDHLDTVKAKTSLAMSLIALNRIAVAEAVAEVSKLTKMPGWNASQWYNFACFCGIASGKVTDKKKEYADQAMELLQKAVKAGYKNAAHMKKDTDLDPLRDRDDFKKLLADLTKKFPPPPELAPPPKAVK